MPVFGNQFESSYRILVSQSQKRPKADLYLFNLADKIPVFLLPLQAGDGEPAINLQELLQLVYERAGYDYLIDYTKEPIPALSESERIWVESVLKEKGFRN